MIPKWLRTWFSRPNLRNSASSHSFKLRVEGLEERVVPAWTVNNLNTVSTAALVNNLTNGKEVVSNITYTGSNLGAGIFTENSNAIGLASGVVLSSGGVTGVAGPNNSNATSTAIGGPGDADLNILSAPAPGFDAAVLEFDIKPKGTFVSFQYVFGSDEYLEFAPPIFGGFTDVFAFYVNGKNVSTIPGTTTAVSIDTVNPAMNSKYFINNFTIPAGPVFGTHNIECDGYTVVMTVNIPINAGKVNHIKLAIQDAVDPLYDSWVLIKTGSLETRVVKTFAPIRFVYSPSTGLYSGIFSVVNNNNVSIPGPLFMSFPNLPKSITITNGGKSPAGVPFFKVPGSGLPKNGIVKVTVQFRNPSKINLGTFFLHQRIDVLSSAPG